MKRRMRRLGGLAMAAALTAGLALNVDAVTLNDAQQKADELEEQKDAVEEEKASLSEKLDTIIKNMQDTQAKLEDKEAEVEEVENELVQAQVDANDQYECMKVRIKYMYESGGNQLFEVLMESENMGDFLNKAEYVSQISEYDRNELIRYQDTVKEVEEKEEKVQSEYKELDQLQSDLVSQQEEVQALIDSNEAKLSDIQEQINANSAELARLQAAAVEAGRLQNEGGTWLEGGGIVVSGNGFFTHPCPDYTAQTSYFGEIREFEVGGHKGNDYAAPTGTPTYAAAAGTVITANYSPSAGNWVVINHGNGLVTKYMHHSALCVTQGQYVEKGQQIGYVGSTGQSTGPHLHFQVEVDGVAVSPDLYL
mgnify:CR=1 FL=1